MLKLTSWEDHNGIERPYVEIHCDGCGEQYFDSDGYGCWRCKDGDKNRAEEAATAVIDDFDYQDQDWEIDEEGHHYCPRCAHHETAYLDRLVKHPMTDEMKKVHDLSIKMNQCLNGVPESGYTTIPVDFLHQVLNALLQYGSLVDRVNAAEADARAALDDYKSDSRTREYFNGWKAKDFLEVHRDVMRHVLDPNFDGVHMSK